jgi:hypothetical protein
MNIEDDTLSTVIDTDTENDAAGGGKAAIAEPSARDDVAAAFKEAEEKEEDKAEKPKPEPKEEVKAEPKAEAKAEPKEEPKEAPEAKEEKAEPEGDKEPKAEKGKHHEAPEKFLPAAKELWRNVPHPVRAEVHRVLSEAEAANEQYKRYDDLRPFDELAKSNGRDLRESLLKLNEVENLLQANPIAGLNAILAEIGPRKQDGQPYTMMEVAQFIAQRGQQGYQQIVQNGQQVQQQQAGHAQIEALQTQIAQMKVEAATRDIVEPFRAANPRYDELQDDIAFFLQSGKIPASLSAPEKLAAAYDMAVRINPASHVSDAPASGGEPADNVRAGDFGGRSQSIKSSPGSVSDDTTDTATSDESVLDSIRAVQRRMKH